MDIKELKQQAKECLSVHGPERHCDFVDCQTVLALIEEIERPRPVFYETRTENSAWPERLADLTVPTIRWPVP